MKALPIALLALAVAGCQANAGHMAPQMLSPATAQLVEVVLVVVVGGLVLVFVLVRVAEGRGHVEHVGQLVRVAVHVVRVGAGGILVEAMGLVEYLRLVLRVEFVIDVRHRVVSRRREEPRRPKSTRAAGIRSYRSRLLSE